MVLCCRECGGDIVLNESPSGRNLTKICSECGVWVEYDRVEQGNINTSSHLLSKGAE